MKVKFNYHDEFLAELRRDPPPSKVLRLTRRLRSTDFGPINLLSVVGTFVNGRGELVVLDERCGQVWAHLGDGPNAETAEAQALASKIMGELEEAAKEAGLEVRAGVIEE